jgi:predicted amidophosphoribosyltransferase
MHAVTHCRACRLLKPVFHKARSVAPYDGPWREGILALKVHPAGDLLDQMANVFRHVLDSRLPGDWKGIVPVPNRNFRRPHASRELARALAWRTGLPCFEDLAFSRTTRPQRGLKRKARLQNMRNSMVARRTWRGEPLLLVDDVMTTGATANESARALKKAGAGRVGVLTLARGTDPAEPGKKNDARVVNPGNFLYNLASIIPGFHRNIQ